MRLHYCALCGVILTYNDDGFPPPSPLSWHQEIRAIRYSQHWNDEKPVLSGLGFIEAQAYRANFNPPRPYTDLGFLERYALPGRAPMIYLFHDVCWKLVPRRVGATLGLQENEERIAELLFHLLQRLSKDCHGIPLATYTFGGVSEYRRPFSNNHTNAYQDLVKDSLQYVMSDPRVDLEEEIRESRATLSCQWQTRQGSPISLDSREDSNTRDPFNRLSNDIILLIMNELSVESICHLRFASRVVASMTSPADLPGTFWKRLFTSPFEMHFYLAGEVHPATHRDIDWRALFARARRLLAEREPGVMNRRRIYQCDSVVCRALEPLLHEENSNWPPTEPRPAQDVLPEGCRLGKRVAVQTTRPCDAQYLPLSSLGDSCPVTISASFIDFDCRFHMSGLVVTTPDGIGRTKTVHQVGINTSAVKEHVTLSEGSSVSGVKVYVDSRGLIGLELLGCDTSLGTLSTSHNFPLNKIAAVAELRPRDSTLLDGLVVYLDICKFIALQAAEAPLTNDGRPAGATAEFLNTAEPPSLPVWKPHIQHKHVYMFRVARPRPKPAGTSNQLLNMEFGGPRGEKLGLLNRVVAMIGNPFGVFQGFEFFYDDGTSQRYGSQKVILSAAKATICIEQSFIVCGKQGERITEIRAEQITFHGTDYISWVWFRTNMGSEHTFQMVGLNRRLDRRPRELATLSPRDGHVLTGLVAETRHDYLVALGVLDAPRDDVVQGIPSDDATAQIVSVQRSLEPPSGGRKRCWSSVTNLKDVTRIQFSRGGPHGRECTDNNITGLILHYRGSERVGIVGQWIKEVDTMEIDAGDSITHIRVCYTKRSEDVRIWPTDGGRVSGLVVETARGARKTVWGSKCEETIHVDFYANLLEEMDGINWQFNHHHDIVHVVNAPRAANRRLLYEDLGEESVFTMCTPRRFLWFEVDNQGNAMGLSAIKAYFATEHRHLKGVKFVYGEAAERSAGHCEGLVSTLRLASTEKIGAMSVKADEKRTHAIVFHTNLQKAVFLHHPSTEVNLGDESHTRYQMDEESIVWTPTTEAEGLKSRAEMEPPADARECVGIWALPSVVWPYTPVKHIGPIFLTGPLKD